MPNVTSSIPIRRAPHTEEFAKTIKTLLAKAKKPSDIDDDVFQATQKLIDYEEQIHNNFIVFNGNPYKPLDWVTAAGSPRSADLLLKKGALPEFVARPLMPESPEVEEVSTEIQAHVDKAKAHHTAIENAFTQSRKNMSNNKSTETENSFKTIQNYANAGYNLNIPFSDGKDLNGSLLLERVALHSMPKATKYLMQNGADPTLQGTLQGGLLPNIKRAVKAEEQDERFNLKNSPAHQNLKDTGLEIESGIIRQKELKERFSQKWLGIAMPSLEKLRATKADHELVVHHFDHGGNADPGQSADKLRKGSPGDYNFILRISKNPDSIEEKHLEHINRIQKKYWTYPTSINTEVKTSDSVGRSNETIDTNKQTKVKTDRKKALAALGIKDEPKLSKAERRKREAAEFRAKRAEELKNQSKAEESSPKTRSRSVSSTSSGTLEHEPSPKASPAHSPVRKSRPSVLNPTSSPAQSSTISNTEPGWEVPPSRGKRHNRGTENTQPQAQPPRMGISSRGNASNRASVRGLRGASNVAPRARGRGTNPTIENERRSASNTTGRGRGTINTSTHRPDMRTRNLRQPIHPNPEPFLQQPGFESTSSASPNPARPLASVSKKIETPPTATRPIGESFLNRSPGNQSPIRTSFEPAPPNTLTLRPKASSSLETARPRLQIPNTAQSDVESSSAIPAPGRVSPPRKSTPLTQPQTPAHATPSPAVVSSTRLQSTTRGRRTRSPLASQKPKQKMGFGDFEVEIDTTKSTSKIVRERSSSPRKSNLPKMAFGDFEVEMDSANKQSRVVGERRRSRSPKKLNPNANAFKP